jgi:vitamin B12 transporter
MFLLFLPAGAHGQSDDDDFVLEFDEEFGITVAGTRQTTQQMAVISREDIEQQGAQDLASLLQDTLSLNIARYGPYGSQTSIHMRGYSSKRVAFLVDGVPVNSAMDGGFDINQIGLDSIERIEVIYGGSDSQFNVSGAMGGVINIVTVRRQEPGWRFSGSVSNTSSMPGEYRGRSGERQSPHWEDLFDAQNIALSAAYGGNGFSFRGGVLANRAANHFIYTDHFNHPRRKENNEVWDAGVNGSFVWKLGSFSRLIASTNFYYGDKNIPTSGF